MAQPRVLILRAPGTNCDEETAHAFALAGGDAGAVARQSRCWKSRGGVAEFQMLCIPGGFSYGDDIAAGRILGNQIQHHLADALDEFRDGRQADPRHLQRLPGAAEDRICWRLPMPPARRRRSR